MDGDTMAEQHKTSENQQPTPINPQSAEQQPTPEDQPPTAEASESGVICKIFVSRKTADGEVLGEDTAIRQELIVLSRGQLQFYDAEDIGMGAHWRGRLRNLLRGCNLLLLILTKPAKDDFGWPLYEAGLFDGLDDDEKERIIMIYPKGEKPPEQLEDIQGIEATERKVIKGLLLPLFKEGKYTTTGKPLDEYRRAKDFRAPSDDFKNGLAQEICDRINGPSEQGTRDTKYINPYMQLVLPVEVRKLCIDLAIELKPEIKEKLEAGLAGIKNAEKRANKERRILAENLSPVDIQSIVKKDTYDKLATIDDIQSIVTVKTVPESIRKLFDLDDRPQVEEKLSLSDIVIAARIPDGDDKDFNRRWIRQLMAAIVSIKLGRSVDHPLTSGYRSTSSYAKEQVKVFAPQMEIWREQHSGEDIVDIVFVRQLEDIWLPKAAPPVALAANLFWASRIRCQLIDHYLNEVPNWKRSSLKRNEGYAELAALVGDIDHDSFFLRTLTWDGINAAFKDDGGAGHDARASELGAIAIQYAGEIDPMLQKALKEMNDDDVTEALTLWRGNNERFLNIALPRYRELLGLQRKEE
jgi:hypothetical protein